MMTMMGTAKLETMNLKVETSRTMEKFNKKIVRADAPLIAVEDLDMAASSRGRLITRVPTHRIRATIAKRYRYPVAELHWVSRNPTSFQYSSALSWKSTIAPMHLARILLTKTTSSIGYDVVNEM